MLAYAVGGKRKPSARGEQTGLNVIRSGDETGRAFEGFAPGGFIRISADGRIALIVPNVEMGQGIYTAEAMLIAEGLEVGLDQVAVENLLQVLRHGSSLHTKEGDRTCLSFASYDDTALAAVANYVRWRGCALKSRDVEAARKVAH